MIYWTRTCVFELRRLYIIYIYRTSNLVSRGQTLPEEGLT